MAAPGSGSSVSAPAEPWRVLRWRSSNQAFVERADGLELVLMRIPPGSFLMGAPEGEEGSKDSERPVHRVGLGEFLMGQTPVTQAQWLQVARWPPPAGRSSWERQLELDPVSQLSDAERFRGDQRPVVNVNWHDAREFCRRLRSDSGKNYCLPSEAQWEYACRAGTTTPFHFGETITPKLANYAAKRSYVGRSTGEHLQQITDVDSFPANAWGLHDMHGNVWEWCADHWHENYALDGRKAPEDGSAWIDEETEFQTQRMMRGGSWHVIPRNCRSACRDLNQSSNASHRVGFRVCWLPLD